MRQNSAGRLARTFICLMASLMVGCNKMSDTVPASNTGISASSASKTVSVPATVPAEAQAQIQKGIQQGQETGAAYEARMKALNQKK